MPMARKETRGARQQVLLELVCRSPHCGCPKIEGTSLGDPIKILGSPSFWETKSSSRTCDSDFELVLPNTELSQEGAGFLGLGYVRFPKIRCTFWGSEYRGLSYSGVCTGSPIYGHYLIGTIKEL